MAGETLHIERLSLRVPSMAVDEARLLGEDVAQQIAEGLPEEVRQEHLGALELRVLLPEGTPRDRLAMLIAEAVLGRLG